MSKKVVIVGGVAGGASAAARLRRLDEHAEIIMFEKGGYISFANCGLPYYIGGEIEERDALLLQTPESFRARFNVDVRINSEVMSIDRANKTVTVQDTKTGKSTTESYDNLILSPGAEPIKPPINGLDSDRVFTLRNIPDTDRIKSFVVEKHPASAAVVGGGYIGVEMAENLRAAGLDVTIIEMQNQVIAPLDYDMACEVHKHIEDKGVHLLLETAMQAVQEQDDKLHVESSKGVLDVDMLVLSIGVRPETKLAKEAGLKLNDRGSIVVDENMRTSDSAIFAAGDAVEVTDFVTGTKGFVPLAGPANKQGRIAADNICGIPSRYTGTQGSAILKVFDLTVATTGLNEKTAKRLGLDYDKVFTTSVSHAGYYPGAQSMAVKTLFEKKTGKILGAQIVGGEGSDKRSDVIATAIRFGATVKDLTELELSYAPPFSSAKDPVNMAGYVAENLLTGKVKHFHWHDVETLPHDGSVTLLDARTSAEYAQGHIDGFINIPVDELRARMGELDKGKPVYVTCQVGLRGYIACRMLGQHGFNCANLDGGFRLYNSVFGGEPINANCSGAGMGTQGAGK
ncbi:FAD-dependent oxidoreductase [Ruminococcaceae bacterium OttesenSCG-928-I18]|nr:FAD-dependent oxidoreductase [Ruminococcaceae bacterium OttesenSCG-928-I18]